jgi:hypothetical protein
MKLSHFLLFLFSGSVLTSHSAPGADSLSSRPKATQWERKKVIQIDKSFGSVNNICWILGGNEVIFSTEDGELGRLNVRTGQLVWFLTATEHHMQIRLHDINSAGTEFLSGTTVTAVGANPNLQIRSTEDGQIIKEIKETSKYVEDPNKQEGLDLRKESNTDAADYPNYEMINWSAKYLPDGKIVTLFCNFQETSFQFDRSFKCYTSSGTKVWEWQQISKNNFTFRNGNWSSYPVPVIQRVKPDLFVYGDGDGDLYFLDNATIQQGKSKIFITDKIPGPLLAKRSLEENIGIGDIRPKDSNLHVLCFGSGSASYYACFDLNTKKRKAAWMELDSDDRKMSLSSSGNYLALGWHQFKIYDGAMNVLFEEGRGSEEKCFRFNPGNEKELIFMDGSDFILLGN